MTGQIYKKPYRYVRPLRDTGIKRSGTDLRPRGAKRRGRLRPPFLLPPFRLSVRYMYASLPHTNTTRARGGRNPCKTRVLLALHGLMSFAAKVAALRAFFTVPDDVPLPRHGATPCRDIETGGTSKRFVRLVWS